MDPLIYLHSTLVPLIPKRIFIVSRVENNLHSTLVPLIPGRVLRRGLTLTDLHSTLVPLIPFSPQPL